MIVRCILPEYWNNLHLGGHNAGVILLDTDMKFSILRLVQLIEKYILHKVSEKPGLVNLDSEVLEKFIIDSLQNLHILRCSDSDKFVLTLHNLESLLCNDPNIAAIMIDSISAFYWIDRMNGGDSIPSQEANMKNATEVLSKLVNSYNLVLFATKNAVFKKKSQDSYGDEERLDLGAEKNRLNEDLDLQHAEFMCKAWQKLVSHRLILVKEEQFENQKQTFVIGGDCAQGNKRFYVSQFGIDMV